MATKNLNATITIGGAISGALKSALGTTRQQLQGIGGSIRELTTRQQRLGAAATHWERMGRDASRFHSELRRVNSELERQRRMQASLRAQDANTARRGELRGQLFDAVALGATLAAPVRVAMEFEQSMAKVGAVARASGEELTRLTATARQLGATTNWTASQVAEGMQFLAMAGFNTEQTIAAMPGMLSLASAGAIDLGAAADIASNILTGFNMRAEEMGRLGDVMTNTFTTSNTNLQMLGESMKYVAPVAAATGVSRPTVLGPWPLGQTGPPGG
jgi:phage-related tail protein